jgi:hypothetical protein
MQGSAACGSKLTAALFIAPRSNDMNVHLEQETQLRPTDRFSLARVPRTQQRQSRWREAFRKAVWYRL